MDVCNILGLTNPSEALSSLDEDEKTTLSNTEGGGRAHTLNAISEAGLYRLIFRSNKPEAKRFSKTVAKALVILRKHGMKAFAKWAPSIGWLEFYGEKGTPARKELTNKLKQHGCEGKDYPIITDAFYVAMLGHTAKEMKENAGKPDCPVARYVCDEDELAMIHLGEIWGVKSLGTNGAADGKDCKKVMQNIGKAIRQAKTTALS